MNLQDETLLVLATNASAHWHLTEFITEFWDTIREQCGPKLRVMMSDSLFDKALYIDESATNLSTNAMVAIAANSGHGGTDINGLLAVVGQMPKYATVRNVIVVYVGNDTLRKSAVDAEWRQFENLVVVVTDDHIAPTVSHDSKQALPNLYNQRIFDPYTFKFLLWGK